MNDMSHLDYMTLTDVRKAWPQIVEGVKEVLATCPDGCNPEEVYAYCRFKKADLWTGKYGFCVTYVRENQHTAEKELFVWLSYCRNQMDGMMGFFDELAELLGCSCIVAISYRKGMDRGFKEWVTHSSVVLERRL